MAKEAEEVVPKDAQLISKLLADQGVTEYEPRVVHQLLSLLYRYGSTLLQDAEAYYDSAGRPAPGLDAEDVALAIQAREAFTFTGAPPKHVMQELAEQINARPLPPVSQRAGLLVPPDEDALLAQNLRLQVQPARLSEGDVSTTAPQGRQPADADSRQALLPGRARLDAFGVRKRPSEATLSDRGAFGDADEDEEGGEEDEQAGGSPAVGGEAMDMSPGADRPPQKPPDPADDGLADALEAELADEEWL